MSQDNDPKPEPAPESRLDKETSSEIRLARQHARENEEPSELMTPISFFLVVMIFALGMWGGLYLAQYSGGWDPMVYNEELAIGAPPPEPPPFDPMREGSRLYNANCAACHQVDGSGVPGVYPPLDGSEWVVKNDAKLVRVLLHGLNGEIQVMGNTYNGNMPGWGQQFNDKRIAAIITYIRNSWSNSVEGVTEEYVAGIRDEEASRSTPWTQEELQPWFID